MRKTVYTIIMFAVCVTTLMLTSCRDDDVIFIPEEVNVSRPEYTSVQGFYLLNEGNMGSNKCTLDYYDYTTGKYTRNIYGNANPSVPKELGDVGNDIAIYGSRLYAVINCSNKVEVMKAGTAERIGQIDVPNCRYIRFYGRYAYVTSYAGPVQIDPDYKQRGYVAKIDTATMQVVDTCVVGYQPDELEIAGGKIYVANSGGYMVPNYENTISVIDLATFKEEERVKVAINLSMIKCDRRGVLWIVARGDYYDVNSDIYAYDTRKKRIVKQMDIRASNVCLDGDSLYVISTQWSNVTMSNTVSYAIINTVTMEKVTDNFITDGTEKKIKIPYGISVNPITKDIYVTDAKDYVSPGTLYCFGQDGVCKWSVRTGDIPAHFVFRGKSNQ
jgi:DNA-binding beta-propeller fold protein YncE